MRGSACTMFTPGDGKRRKTVPSRRDRADTPKRAVTSWFGSGARRASRHLIRVHAEDDAAMRRGIVRPEGARHQFAEQPFGALVGVGRARLWIEQMKRSL